MATTSPPVSDYPVTFSVDYPDRPLDRLSTGLRFLWIIPIGIIVASVSGYTYYRGVSGSIVVLTSAGGVLFGGPLLMILFRQKYPRWWFDWNLELLRFQNRVSAYWLLLRDEYPSTDDHQSVHLEIPYPDASRDLNRWLPLVKWLLAIPHYIVLFFLYIGVFVASIVAWFAIVFTGLYPRGLFDFIVGVSRWYNRVYAYAVVLATDEYPPFRLAP
jgi:small-conductance mechanosensitive channel